MSYAGVVVDVMLLHRCHLEGALGSLALLLIVHHWAVLVIFDVGSVGQYRVDIRVSCVHSIPDTGLFCHRLLILNGMASLILFFHLR